MTLALYLARRFALSLLLMLTIFAAVVYLIDLIEQLRRLSTRPEAGLADAMVLAALNLPKVMYQILPLTVMLASIAYFVGLSRSSELVAIRAAGRSALRALVAPIIVAMIVGALAVAVMNPVVSMTTRMFESLQDRIQTGEERVLSITADGLWLRQGTDTGQTVIRALRSNADGTLLFGASFLTFTLEGPPTQRIAAPRAELRPGEWVLHDAKIWRLDDENPEASAELIGRMTLPTDLTPTKIRDSFGSPEVISIWEMRDFIDGLDRAGFASTLHRVWLQKELATPALLAAIVLLAAGFTMRHARFGKTGVLVLSAILAGFAVFFLRNFAQVLGENGQLPVLLAAWAPPFAAAFAALGLLLYLEDG
jgi:lipopolysaccharide export system permease protein